MADFCKQCSIEMFGEDSRDFAGMCNEGESAWALREGCGTTEVNCRGECVHHKASGGTSDRCFNAGGMQALEQMKKHGAFDD